MAAAHIETRTGAEPLRSEAFAFIWKLLLWIAPIFGKMPQPVCMSGLLVHRRLTVEQSTGRK
jgi:hypothetical protein